MKSSWETSNIFNFITNVKCHEWVYCHIKSHLLEIRYTFSVHVTNKPERLPCLYWKMINNTWMCKREIVQLKTVLSITQFYRQNVKLRIYIVCSYYILWTFYFCSNNYLGYFRPILFTNLRRQILQTAFHPFNVHNL